MNSNKNNNRRASSKSDKKVVRRSYTPISDALENPQVFADTELGDGINRHGLVNEFSKVIRKPRRSDAEGLPGILIALLVWPFLGMHASSIHSFCTELCQFIKGTTGKGTRKMDILYSLLRREDINWRTLAKRLSKSTAASIDLGQVERRAFVIDDSIKSRRGKKVEGSSRHWNHTEGRSVQGHQIVEFGIAGENGFLPLDRQIFMGKENAVEKPANKDFRDKRSAAARDMARAREESKHTMFRRLLRSAINEGYTAKYVLADAWFGCKENIEAALACDVVAIFQMKRGKMKYWIENPESNQEGTGYTARQLHEKYQRRMKVASKDARYKTYRIKVWVNLETKPKGKPRWQQVVLVLSAPVKQRIHVDGSDCWVLFLCTDLDASAEEVLSIYALRWSIEVYFKEAKQNFGLLSEQSGAYQYAYASVHLAAMRYTLLFEAMLRNGFLSYGEMRDRQTGHLQVLSFAGLLWQLFRGIIEGALGALKETLDEKILATIMSAIDEEIDNFLNRALQFDAKVIKSQINAEASGYL